MKGAASEEQVVTTPWLLPKGAVRGGQAVMGRAGTSSDALFLVMIH